MIQYKTHLVLKCVNQDQPKKNRLFIFILFILHYLINRVLYVFKVFISCMFTFIKCQQVLSGQKVDI